MGHLLLSIDTSLHLTQNLKFLKRTQRSLFRIDLAFPFFTKFPSQIIFLIVKIYER